MKRVVRPDEFNLETQISRAMNEMDCAMSEAAAVVERVRFLGNRLLAEYKAAEERTFNLDVFTEKEAAGLLKLGEWQLANMRKNTPNFPHCNFSRTPRYTKEHLLEICSMFENKDEPARARSAA